MGKKIVSIDFLLCILRLQNMFQYSFKYIKNKSFFKNYSILLLVNWIQNHYISFHKQNIIFKNYIMQLCIDKV